MAKRSLTETAKAILMKESNDPTPDREAKKVVPNSATLRPGSKTKEEPFATPGSTPPNPGEKQDLGAATVSPTDPATGPAVASKTTGKDKSGSSQSRVGTVAGDVRKALSEEGKALHGVNLSEEDLAILDEFITEQLKADKTDEQIAEEITNTFEIIKEEPEDDDQEVIVAEDVEVIDEEQIEGNVEGRKDVTSDVTDKIMKVKDKILGKAPETRNANMQEHVDALLEGEDLSDEFKAKAKTIFEAAINAKLAPEIARIEKLAEDRLVEEVQAIEAKLEEDVTDFVNHVVESWVSENEVAIESGLRNELTEGFITQLRNVFVENYIDIPEEKVNVVEEMAARVQELEGKLNEQIEAGIEQTKKFNELKKDSIIAEASDGLADTQVAKLKELAEGITFTTPAEFSEKLNTLKESYFPTDSVKNDKVLDEVDQTLNGKKIVSESNDRIAGYARALGKKLPR